MRSLYYIYHEPPTDYFKMDWDRMLKVAVLFVCLRLLMLLLSC